MAADMLFEIGVEEIPAPVVLPALRQLEEKAAAGLTAARLEHGPLTTWGTPRRLTLHVADVALRQPDVELEIKGPPASAAFDAGLAAGRRGEHALEEAHYRAVLILDPDHGRAAFNLAVTLAQAGRRGEALEWTERAAELLPGDERPAQLRRTLSASP